MSRPESIPEEKPDSPAKFCITGRPDANYEPGSGRSNTAWDIE